MSLALDPVNDLEPDTDAVRRLPDHVVAELSRRPLFIALEGGEGSGKSTQARLLAERLGALLTHEPGGTALGRVVRSTVLHDLSGDDAPIPLAEALLMCADRAQHVARVIVPALAEGRHVVTDRFAGSTIAYQGFGRGVDLTVLDHLSELATAGLSPDLTIVLDVPDEVARARRARTADDVIEAAGEEFHARVAAGFEHQSRTRPDWCVVDGVGEPEDIAERVWSQVVTRLAP